MGLYVFDDFVLRTKEILLQNRKENDQWLNYGMQAYIGKYRKRNIWWAIVFHRLMTESMASLKIDTREIRQFDNISLNSHKETKETQTVAARPCFWVTL